MGQGTELRRHHRNQHDDVRMRCVHSARKGGHIEKCADCDKDDCNKLLEAGTDFECEKYEFKDSKFTAAATKTKCKGLKGTDNVCSKPGAEAKKDADYTVMKDGCGKCDATQLGAKKCAEVAGAAGLTAFLLPLLAALYTLF